MIDFLLYFIKKIIVKTTKKIIYMYTLINYIILI